MFFVHLQIDMRNIVMKISAVLLVVWYCMSIIGFDVHTCSGSGRTFVASCISGMTCEDIHPEHHCDHHSCCGTVRQEADDQHDCTGSGDGCHCLTLKAKSCCSDDFQVLLLTGNRTDDEHRHYDFCHCGHCPCVEAFCSDILPSYPQDKFMSSLRIPDKGLIAGRELLSRINIWRI